MISCRRAAPVDELRVTQVWVNDPYAVELGSQMVW